MPVGGVLGPYIRFRGLQPHRDDRKDARIINLDNNNNVIMRVQSQISIQPQLSGIV